MIYEILVYLLDHDFQGLILVTTAVVVEVKVQEFDVVLEVALVNLSHVLSGDAHFTGCFVAKEINYVNGPVCLDDIVDVGAEGLLRHLRVARDNDLFHDAFLLPEDGHGASYLYVAEQESAIDNEDLLSLALVTNIALIVNAASVIASTSSRVHPASQQSYNDIQLPELA